VLVLFLILFVPRPYIIVLYKSICFSGSISLLYLRSTRLVFNQKIYKVRILVLFGIITSL
jgi:hypothetical protein